MGHGAGVALSRSDLKLLAELYDPLDPDRSDLEPYLAHAMEVGARRVLDVGCGTGVLAVDLAARGLEVVGLDPDPYSLAVARAKQGAHHVRWIQGDVTALPAGASADLATMTANVAQAIVEDKLWSATLRGIRRALRPGGELMFETRNPARRAWEVWAPETTRVTANVAGIGAVTSWVQTERVRWPLADLAETTVLPDGRTLVSRQPLRFRERTEVEADLAVAGFEVLEVRDAPDRPGCEFVFLARRRVI
jgi:SAM-dependent methyltransferase